MAMSTDEWKRLLGHTPAGQATSRAIAQKPSPCVPQLPQELLAHPGRRRRLSGASDRATIGPSGASGNGAMPRAAVIQPASTHDRCEEDDDVLSSAMGSVTTTGAVVLGLADFRALLEQGAEPEGAFERRFASHAFRAMVAEQGGAPLAENGARRPVSPPVTAQLVIRAPPEPRQHAGTAGAPACDPAPGAVAKPTAAPTAASSRGPARMSVEELLTKVQAKAAHSASLKAHIDRLRSERKAMEDTDENDGIEAGDRASDSAGRHVRFAGGRSAATTVPAAAPGDARPLRVGGTAAHPSSAEAWRAHEAAARREATARRAKAAQGAGMSASAFRARLDTAGAGAGVGHTAIEAGDARLAGGHDRAATAPKQDEADRRQAEQDEADRRQAEQDEADRRQAEQDEADRRQAEQDEADRRQAEQDEADRRQAEQDETGPDPNRAAPDQSAVEAASAALAAAADATEAVEAACSRRASSASSVSLGLPIRPAPGILMSESVGRTVGSGGPASIAGLRVLQPTPPRPQAHSSGSSARHIPPPSRLGGTVSPTSDGEGSPSDLGASVEGDVEEPAAAASPPAGATLARPRFSHSPVSSVSSSGDGSGAETAPPHGAPSPRGTPESPKEDEQEHETHGPSPFTPTSSAGRDSPPRVAEPPRPQPSGDGARSPPRPPRLSDPVRVTQDDVAVDVPLIAALTTSTVPGPATPPAPTPAPATSGAFRAIRAVAAEMSAFNDSLRLRSGTLAASAAPPSLAYSHAIGLASAAGLRGASTLPVGGASPPEAGRRQWRGGLAGTWQAEGGRWGAASMPGGAGDDEDDVYGDDLARFWRQQDAADAASARLPGAEAMALEDGSPPRGIRGRSSDADSFTPTRPPPPPPDSLPSPTVVAAPPPPPLPRGSPLATPSSRREQARSRVQARIRARLGASAAPGSASAALALPARDRRHGSHRHPSRVVMSASVAPLDPPHEVGPPSPTSDAGGAWQARASTVLGVSGLIGPRTPPGRARRAPAQPSAWEEGAAVAAAAAAAAARGAADAAAMAATSLGPRSPAPPLALPTHAAPVPRRQWRRDDDGSDDDVATRASHVDGRGAPVSLVAHGSPMARRHKPLPRGFRAPPPPPSSSVPTLQGRSDASGAPRRYPNPFDSPPVSRGGSTRGRLPSLPGLDDAVASQQQSDGLSVFDSPQLSARGSGANSPMQIA